MTSHIIRKICILTEVFSLSFRYSDPDMMLFLRESSCLDPRFKAMPYLDDEERDKVYKSLAQKAEDVNQMATQV